MHASEYTHHQCKGCDYDCRSNGCPFDYVSEEPKRSLRDKGIDAAASYLERTGAAVVERGYTGPGKAHVDLVAVDADGTVVLVDVFVRKTTNGKVVEDMSTARERNLRRIARAYMEDVVKVSGVPVAECAVRYDRISLLVISEDRALLRHHREVLTLMQPEHVEEPTSTYGGTKVAGKSIRFPKYVAPTLPEGVYAYKPVIVREDSSESTITGIGVAMSTPDDVYEVVRDLRHEDREHFVVLMLNTKNRLIGRSNVSIGSLNSSIVHPRELYKAAVLMGAAAIILVHNHPSGDTTPSGADIQLTRRLCKAGDVLGIDVLDHVVVSHEGYTSMRDTGLM